MKKRLFETENMFKRRQEIEFAKQQIAGMKLWRIDAIEMKPAGNGGYSMGRLDHFTVEAYCKEMAIGAFKTGTHMSWFVVDVREEDVLH